MYYVSLRPDMGTRLLWMRVQLHEAKHLRLELNTCKLRWPRADISAHLGKKHVCFKTSQNLWYWSKFQNSKSYGKRKTSSLDFFNENIHFHMLNLLGMWLNVWNLELAKNPALGAFESFGFGFSLMIQQKFLLSLGFVVPPKIKAFDSDSWSQKVKAYLTWLIKIEFYTCVLKSSFTHM